MDERMVNRGLLEEARFYFAQCTFSTTCNYKAADRLKKSIAKRKLLASVLAIISVLLTFAQLVNATQQLNLTTAIWGISLLASASSIIYQVLNDSLADEQKVRFENTAEQYKDLRDHLLEG